MAFSRECRLGGLGPELVVNGTFDADSNWVKDVGWTISNGVATGVSSGVSKVISSEDYFGLGYLKVYQVSLEISVTGDATISVSIYGDETTTVISGATSGTTVKFINTEVSDVILQITVSATSGTAVIDNVSAKELKAKRRL